MEKRAQGSHAAGHRPVFDSIGFLYDMVSNMKKAKVCKNCIVKRKGHTEEFDERKVYASVYAACASAHYHEPECEKLANTISKSVKRFIKSKKSVHSSRLREKINSELKKKDKELAFYYEQHLPDLKRL